MKFSQVVKKIRTQPKPITQATISFLSNTRARIEGEYNHQAVSLALAYHPPGYKFAPSYRAHMWDGFVRLMTSDGTFPAGLVPLVVATAEEHGAKVKVGERMTRPDLPITHTNDFKLDGVDLYPWQKKAIRVAIAEGRGILKIATGGGKTEVAAGLIRALTSPERPPKTLIVVPNRNLLTQTKNRLEERLGYEIGTIGFGKWNEDYVTIAIPNSLMAAKFKKQRKQLMQNVEMFIPDECHRTGSETWNKLAGSCKAWYRFGLSGTPLNRADGGDLKLVGQTGEVLVDISSSLLVAQGKLAKPTVRMVDVKKPILASGLDWPDVYSQGIVRNETFHKIVVREVKREVAAEKATLILVTQIAHGDALQAYFDMEGINTEFVHGKTDPEEIEDAVKRFKKGKLAVLIASPIFGEGTDIPAIDTLVVADGGKSAIKTVQKAGRAMRVKTNKPNECTIIDFNHYTHEKLHRHSVQRRDTYLGQEFEVVNPTVGIE